MATLVKLERVYFLDENGRKVAKGTAGARKKIWVSPKWYIRFYSAGKKKQIPAHRDRRASEEKLRKLIESLERGQEGLIDPYQAHAERAAVEHLEEYLPVLRDRVTEIHFSRTEGILRKVCTGRLADLTSESVEIYLTALQVAPNTKKKHHSAIRGFVKWLFQRNRLKEDFMERVPCPRGGVVNEVRSLTAPELLKLLEVTRTRPLIDALLIRWGPRKGKLEAKVRAEVRCQLERDGYSRWLLYKTALLTALRKEELARLQVCHVDFENQPCPVIDLSAGITKAKKKAALWLVPSHAAELQKWIATTGKKSSDLLFGPLSPKLNSIFKRDLQAASIPETTDKGKASFRSLRNSANVYLRSMGIHPKTRQLFMRHSDIRLTCDTYDDGILTDMVELIPVLDSLSIEALHRSTTPTPATPTPAPPTTDTSTGLQIARTEI